MGECDISQSVQFTTCMCVSLHVCPYHGTVRYIPVCSIYHMYVCVSLCPSHYIVPWESGTHPSPSHINTTCTCTCVSLHVCPSHSIVPWESGTHPSPSHIPHVCVYPYIHPITSYHGRVGHIPVCPILIPHIHVHVYPYMHVHPVPSYHERVGHIPVRPIYHMYVCVSLCPSCPSVP